MNTGRTAIVVGALALSIVTLLPACGDERGDAASPPVDAGTQSGPGAAEATDTNSMAERLAAYDRGLDFLASQQTDGKWGFEGQPHVGITAIAVTGLLERPGGMREKDGAIVDLALPYLSATIGKDGSVSESYRPNYETSVVIMALAASGRAEYDAQIAAAAGFIKSLQRLDEKNPTYGGIGYGSDNTRSDLSNTQYALASLKAAGISEDDPVWERVVTFLSRTQNRKENEGPDEPRQWTDPKTGYKLVRSNDGGANYFPGNSKAGSDERPDGVGVLRSYGSMTYALLRCYHFAGLDAQDPRVKAAADWVAANWDLAGNPGMPEEQRLEGLYYYYATIGKTLPVAGIDVLEVPGRGGIDWRADLARELLVRQREDGSWSNENSRWMETVPALVTSYALSALAPCTR